MGVHRSTKPAAARQAVNLSVDRTVLEAARALKLYLSETLEIRLRELIRARERADWLAENRPAIEDYNRRIERNGVFSDGVRRFRRLGSTSIATRIQRPRPLSPSCWTSRAASSAN